ncbi:sulfatase [Paenibacillus thalictri]|uniref:Sulfatase n=1 Tax=Paenibacillus thalictri TaxID=2527873 RepID=A0A4Q9DNL7_9BACL|nr:sulfatase [Paenibacillus thalictri]TBL76063.1 sulfatase [Paenibacillus thalictri]
MNIIYMHSHDTGRYIEPYGHAVPTPNVMAFAREGVLFRHAYCAGPTCSPSRSALLTGMVPHSNGMIGLAHRGFSLNNYDQHVVRQLKGLGYETVLCGVQHEAADASSIGYRHILAKSAGSDKDDLHNAALAAEYIQASGKKQPFFLSFGMFNTHRDFPELDGTINPDYVIPPFPLADTAENRKDTAAYMMSARTMDACVGIVLEAVRSSGLEDDTLIIYTTDHGPAFPRMKCNLYDTGIGVSLIMKHPSFSNGRAVDGLVSHIDLLPTIYDMIGVEAPGHTQGVSLLPLLQNKTDSVRSEVFAEVTYHAAYEPMRCVRTDRYKYIRRFGDRFRPTLANIDDGGSKSFMLQHGLQDEAYCEEMLFDLALDPVERVNLAKDEKYSHVYETMSLRLKEWMEETGDPLLNGPVPFPPGARINLPESLSPRESTFL